MASEKDKFLIVIKGSGTTLKPQHKTVNADEYWDIEWSTATTVPMMIDFFNITIGRIVRSETDPHKKSIEEVWRVTGIPGHARKIRYGISLPETTSIGAKPLDQGHYVVKINGMTNITEGLQVEAGVGVAIINLKKGETVAVETPQPKPNAEAAAPTMETSNDVQITNATIVKLLKLSEEDESAS